MYDGRADRTGPDRVDQTTRHSNTAPYGQLAVIGIREALGSLSPKVVQLLERAVATTGEPMRTKPARLQRQVPLSPEAVWELAADYKTGSSVRELSRKYGINRETVMLHFERSGIPRRIKARRLTDDDVVRAAEMYEAAASLATVGDAFGVYAQTIRCEFRKAGIPARPRPGRA